MDVMELYNSIMTAENEMDIVHLNIEIHEHIKSGRIDDNTEIMMLNMALQIKSNFFLLREMAINGAMSVIMGDGQEFDPEEAQLEEFHKEEFEDFKNGNVVSMKDFRKKE